MILLIDHNDSFVFNLAHYVQELGYQAEVVRHDKITLDAVASKVPDKIILSPGPCDPTKAGLSVALVKRFYRSVPILGVCLGHQIIAHAFGAKVSRAMLPVHGKSTEIVHHGCDVFQGLASPLKVGRYHSLVVHQEGFPEALMITAETPLGEVMALRHKRYPVYGVQFHPESVMTESGHALLANFLSEGG